MSTTFPFPVPPLLVDALRSARRLVAFTGAGVSAESGVATFRDAQTGIWARFSPEALATPDAFAADPERVWAWYETRRAGVLATAPNPAHHALAGLAARLPESRLITQNVDDLHERAGSTGVLHLHGSLFAARCFDCARPAPLPPPLAAGAQPDRLAPPRCTACGGPLRPGVVWFGESLPADVWAAAEAATAACDLFLCIGTSALVWPAAELPSLAVRRGARLAVINPAPTPLDRAAGWCLAAPAGQALPALLAAAWPE